MAPIKFYYDLMSQPARALYIFLKSTKIPFENCPVALRKGEHLTKEYQQNVNQFQKVPCIIDNGWKLSESIAILKYLVRENKNLVADHWYPNDSKSRARVDEYLEWQHLNTRTGCSGYFMHKWLLPFRTGKPSDEKRVAEAKNQMESTLNIIENVWLKENRFITSNEISIADLLAVCEVEQLLVTGYNPSDGRPKLKAWLDLVKKTTSPFYEEANEFLYKVANMNNAKL